MKITLTWVNRNTGEDGTKIFRATSPFSDVSAMTPIATLPPGATTYDDNTAVLNTLYYYRTQVYVGSDGFLGNQVAITALPYTGPGPIGLIGDFERGYFGELTFAEFISAENLSFQMNVTAGSVTVPNPTTGTGWLKFAWKGKILFISKQPIRQSLSWNSLYNLGLVYGVNNNGPIIPTTAVATNQYKTIDINGDRFIVRLIRGAPTNPAVFTGITANSDVTGLNGSEWNDLLYSIVNTVPADQTWGNLRNAPDADIVGNGNGGQWTTICQESIDSAGANIFVRGGTTYIGGVGQAGPTLAANTINMNGSIARQLCWRPVLEYVP